VDHPVCRVTAFEILGPYKVRIEFDDGVSRTIDFEPVLEGDLYGPLKDPGLFDKAEIDPEVHTLVWPNGADFDPAVLHDWPENRPAFEEMARRWAAEASGSRE